jgi:AAA family ATP:ADP antiporter
MAVSVQTLPGGEKSWLDRALSIVSDVRPGEGVTTALMLINIFLLLVCYSVIKTVREPLILIGGGGATWRAYSSAGMALLLMVFIPFYSWFASRVDRVKLLVGVTVFFLINIELFALAVAAQTPYIGVAFFIWVGIFNNSTVALFWSYANDIYSKEAGDRLFPVITIGMTAGAPLGSLIAARLFGGGVQPQLILQVSAVLLACTLVFYLLVNARATHGAQAATAALPRGGGFGLVLRSEYLRLVALLIVLLNIVNTTGEFLRANLLQGEAAARKAADPAFDATAYVGAFTGTTQFWQNVLALLLQMFLASRLIKHQGLRGVLLFLPLVALGGYTLAAVGVGLMMINTIKSVENATDYSIMNTARQLLWLPTSREEKYKAKQAIDTFFVRGGDVLSAVLVYIGTQAALGIRGYAITNVILTLAWIAVAFLIIRQYRTLEQQNASR